MTFEPLDFADFHLALTVVFLALAFLGWWRRPVVNVTIQVHRDEDEAEAWRGGADDDDDDD